MAVRRIKGSWWADLHFEDKRYRKRSPENSRAGALAYEATLRQRLARGEQIDGKKRLSERHTFAEFAARWLKEYVVPNNKPSEYKAKKYVLSASLMPFFGRSDVSAIGTHDVERYKAKLIREGLSRKTINNRLTILRKCLQTAYDWLSIDQQFPKFQWLKCPPPRTDYLAMEECERLLEHSSGIVREMILAALRTGMRQGELKGLQWESIDWQNNSLAVRHSRSDYTKSLGSPKGNRERYIPLDIDLVEALRARRQEKGYVFTDASGRPFNHNHLSKALANVCDRAGVRKVGWHTLRHTFASHLAMNGTPLHIVQILLGHVSITTTMRYAHVAPSALRAAIDMANPRTAVEKDFGQPVGNRWQEWQTHRRVGGGAAAEKQASMRACPADDMPLPT